MVNFPIGFISVLLAISFLVLGICAPFPFMESEAQLAVGIAVCALILWTTQPIPIEFTSLVLLLTIPWSGLLSFKQTFQPFANPTVWLVFSGMVLSHALTTSGLARNLAKLALNFIGGSRLRLLFSLHAIGLIAAIFIPSGVVRVLLLMPFGIAVIERYRGKSNPVFDATILIALVSSTYYGGCGILTGGVPNLVVAGQLEETTGRMLFWGEWFVWMFPVIGLLRTGLVLGVIWILFARHVSTTSWSLEIDPGPIHLDSYQRRVLAILLAGMAMWSTDAIHNIPPVYVGILLIVACVIPAWGPLRFEQIREINFPFFFYLVALFAIGNILQESGFTDLALKTLLSNIEIETYSVFLQHLTLTAIVIPLNFLMDIAAVGAVATPTMIELGQHHGLDPISVTMSVAMATTLVFLPYQSAPFMVALGFQRFTLGQLISCMMLISVLAALLLCPLNIVYWYWIGLI